MDEKRETVDQRWGHAKTQRWTYQKTDGTERAGRRGSVYVFVCARWCLYAPAEPQQSGNTEANLNGE